MMMRDIDDDYDDDDEDDDDDNDDVLVILLLLSVVLLFWLFTSQGCSLHLLRVKFVAALVGHLDGIVEKNIGDPTFKDRRNHANDFNHCKDNMCYPDGS